MRTRCCAAKEIVSLDIPLSFSFPAPLIISISPYNLLRVSNHAPFNQSVRHAPMQRKMQGYAARIALKPIPFSAALPAIDRNQQPLSRRERSPQSPASAVSRALDSDGHCDKDDNH
jgi:hypothetical protein